MQEGIIDKEIPISFYYQIQKDIKTRIEKGEWKPNEFIPPENELSKLYDVSRVTIRQALKNLAREKILITIKGKGSKVAEPKILFSEPLYRAIGHYDELVNKNFKVENKIIDFRHCKPTKSIEKELNINKNDKILYFSRLRNINDKPSFLSFSYLPFNKFKDLQKEDLEKGSFFEILKTKYKIRFGKLKRTIESAILEKEYANYFNLRVGFPIFIWEEWLSDENNSIVEYSITRARSDIIKIEFTVSTNKEIDLETGIKS
ncbi:MAG: GntR family transcriptional regulator [Actinobacteria bacterium]|nr:GntR family transcriptional regulator [Actinomycetota bacterium]